VSVRIHRASAVVRITQYYLVEIGGFRIFPGVPVGSAVDPTVVPVLFAVEIRPSSKFKDVTLAQIGAKENSSVPGQKYPISSPVWIL
jgi:hypothetical protein